MKLFLKCLTVGGLFLMLGCGGMSKKDCSTADMTEMGKSDGLKGLSEREVLKTQAACEAKGVDISLTNYKEGWKSGIAEFCSEENAYQLGFGDAKAKPENCPVELIPTFKTAYSKGVEVRKAEKKMTEAKEKAEREMADAKAKSRQAKKEQAKLKSKIENLESKIEKNSN